MIYNLAISNYSMDNIAYHLTTVEEEKRLMSLIKDFEGFYSRTINKILIYSVAQNNTECNTVVCSISKVERFNQKIIIRFNKERELNTRCAEVKKSLYIKRCESGLRNEADLYIIPLNDVDFNDICYPEEEQKRNADLLSKLDEYKSKSRWLDMIKEFGDLDQIEHHEFWNNHYLLDKYLVYPLSHLVTAGDKYHVRDKMLPYFKKSIERVLNLRPNKVETLAVYAYFYYCNYMDLKRGHLEEDYKAAENIYNKIFDVYPNHIQSLYRFAKLNQLYLNQHKFSKDLENKIFYKKIENLYNTVIEQYESNVEGNKRYEYEYVSSLYNLLKFRQEVFLDYGRVYFEHRIFNKDVSKMLNADKENQLKMLLSLSEKLMGVLNINKNTPIEQMVRSTKKDQIDVFYRVAISYQSMAFYSDMVGKCENLLKYCLLSNEYVNVAFNIYFKREKMGLRGRKPNHLYKIKAVNSYFIGEKEKAIDSLMRGKSDSIYMAAELLLLDENKTRAKDALKKIEANDRLNMFNKAEKLLQRIDDV